MTKPRSRMGWVAALSCLALTLPMARPGAGAVSIFGDRIQVASDPNAKNYATAVAVQPDGSFVVAWYKQEIFANGSSTWNAMARIFDADGAPVAPQILVGPWGGAPRALTLPGGRYVVAFGGVAVILDTAGAPLGSLFPLDPNAGPQLWDSNFQLVRTSGGFAALWVRELVVSGYPYPTGDPRWVWELHLQKFSDTGAALGFDLTLTPRAPLYQWNYTSAGFAPLAGGGFCLSWFVEDALGLTAQLHARLLDEEGNPATPDARLSDTALTTGGYTSVVGNPDGTCSVFWPSLGMLAVRRLAADGALSPMVMPFTGWPSGFVGDGRGHVLAATGGSLSTLDELGHSIAPTLVFTTSRNVVSADLATNGEGTAVLAWVGNDNVDYTYTGEVYVRRFRWTCVADGHHLCLGANGRFALDAIWHTPDGNQGPATPAPLRSDTGGFWFFSPSNVELLVKVLDGRAVNDHFWVLWGGMTNLAVDLHVTDTLSGAPRTYTNPAGTFPSQADVDALPGTASDRPSRSRPEPVLDAEAAAASASCVATATALCLHGRFLLEVAWDDGAGHTGLGQTVPASEDSGYLWFFSPGNIEMAVKVLDGTPVNGRFWVFAAGLTDVHTTMTVTDTHTGAVRVYDKPAGEMRSFADTDAF